MTKGRIAGALLLLLLGSAAVYSQQEITRLTNLEVNRGFLRTGASVPFEMEGTTNDGFEFKILIDPTEDVTWILPAAAGSAGTQLQTNGTAGIQTITWASAASTRDVKVLDGLLNPQDALRAVVSAPIHRFHYKPGAGTQDTATQYAGIVADEAPWAMHHAGTILNPINTSGYAFAAIQAQQQQIDALKAEIATLRAGR